MNRKTMIVKRIGIQFTVLLLLGVAFSGCNESDSSSGDSASGDSQVLESELLKIASEYKDYGRVDGDLRWAPTSCRTPLPSMARISASDDTDTHGEKLYFMFARDRDAYKSFESSSQPAGQAIVKEGWNPKLIDPEREIPSTLMDLERDSQGSRWYFKYAKQDEKWFEPDGQSQLFIMYKPASPSQESSIETDEGWIYAVVNSEATQVLSKGKIDSCMNCHQDSKHDRMFGLPQVNP